MILLGAALPTALAGYADVGPGFDELNEGVEHNTHYPSLEERELHMYTNMARVEPEAFEALYNQGGCSTDVFSPDELTPKKPVYFSRELNEAARYHCQDMSDNNWFAHESSDGTSFGARTARWYSDSSMVGENIAVGYPSPLATVFSGWMCSTEGHRANIMSGSWNELGTGVVNAYYTQDFGAGTLDTSMNIAMGVHSPPLPTAGDEVTFWADYAGPGPDSMELVLTGQAHAMELAYGDEQKGVWEVVVDFPDGTFRGDGCEQYYFVYTDSEGVGRFPETGSYRVGQACDDPWYGWSPWQFGVTGRDDLSDEELTGDVDITGSGCATAPAGALPGVLFLLGVMAIPRRRHSTWGATRTALP